jgi:hypothetical protein
MGGALMNEGAQIQQQIKIEQEKNDTTRVEDAWNQYKNKALELTIGEKGLLNTKGADAVNGNILNQANATLTDTRKLIEQTLTNPEQIRRFQQRADVTDLQTKHQVLSHLVSQQQEYAKTVFTGSEAAARAQVALKCHELLAAIGAAQALADEMESAELSAVGPRWTGCPAPGVPEMVAGLALECSEGVIDAEAVRELQRKAGLFIEPAFIESQARPAPAAKPSIRKRAAEVIGELLG